MRKAKLELVIETSVPGVVRKRLPTNLRSDLRRVMLALMEARAVQAQVCLVLSSDAHLRALKLKHWGEDATTDVLSFPQWEPGDSFVPAHLGDIFISLETAQVQALTHGHDLKSEVVVLASHGLTHLLGFDHQTPEAWAVFEQAQTDALRLLRQARGPVLLQDVVQTTTKGLNG